MVNLKFMKIARNHERLHTHKVTLTSEYLFSHEICMQSLFVNAVINVSAYIYCNFNNIFEEFVS